MVLDPSFCFECDVDKITTDYGFACPKCGLSEIMPASPPFKKNIWLYRKSKHSRIYWIKKSLEKRSVEAALVGIIVGDFFTILTVLNKYNILKTRNLSRYDYYIIRIITRNGLPIDTGLFRDLIDGTQIKKTYDNRLFGDVFVRLGWDKDCACPHFKRWKNQKRAKG